MAHAIILGEKHSLEKLSKLVWIELRKFGIAFSSLITTGSKR